MYTVQNISLHFGDLHLLEDLSFVINNKDKVALLGKNGAGKTTLFKLITGEIEADNGQISIPRNTKIAYLSQHFEFDEDRNILDICMDAFQEYFGIIEKITLANENLGQTSDEKEIHKILEEINALEIQRAALAENNPEAEVSKILKGFGFQESQLDQPVSTLSGGWKMRVQMARMLLSKPNLLLLDEPDNHLDIEALIWFENYLKKYEGAIVFISHDVQFISNLANRVLELANRKIFDFKGSYKKYIEAKVVRREKELQAFNNQQKQIKSKERTITRFMAKATKTKMAQSMKKQLDKVDRIEIERDDFNLLKIKFPVVHAPGRMVVKITDLNKSYGSNEVLKNLSIEIERGQKLAFVGQNGQGKSTLVKIIAGKLDFDSGSVTIGHNVIPNYFAQNQSEIFEEKYTLLETLEHEADPEFQTRARHILGSFAFSGEDVEKKISVLSGGEKSRLAMACLVSKKSNFLILDEPTNHLDIEAKAILKQAIIDYPGTLIIVSHDRDILSGSVDITYEFRDKNIIQHLGDLDYVLEKRKINDVREFGRANISSRSMDKEEKKSTKDYNQQKQLKRKISATERAIEKLEERIQLIHDKLMDPKFYNSEESPPALKELSKLESELELKTKEWDELVSTMAN